MSSEPAAPHDPRPSQSTKLAHAADAGLLAALASIRHEAAAIATLADRLGTAFCATVDCIAFSGGHVVVTGLGKSGLIGLKIAATLASTGTPALFMHAGDALHGDVGMITAHDVVLALSYSGETREVCEVARLAMSLGVPVVALTGGIDSSLSRMATHVLDVAVAREADPLDLAPTASTAAALAMGDALAAALIVRHGFTATDFARSHPSGSLGRRLQDDV